ncbi:MAG: VOC family protein [Thermoplasmata archaeon]|nr:VOC family protein [Thermoplasmata archaeon]
MKGVQSVLADKEKILIKKIDPILLWVDDFSNCLSFYRKGLGMSLRKQVGEFAELDAGGVTLALHGTQDGESPRTRTQDAPVALHFVAKDMEKLRASLEAWGGSFSREPEEVERGGFKVLEARFRDPDGNEMAVVQNL